MKYQRVIPRDFFNEAKLLKCMGQLSLKILNIAVPNNIKITIEGNGEPFKIYLLDEGSLFVGNYEILVNDIPMRFKTIYNSQANYPLYCEFDYVDYLVFDESGEFTEEFIEFFKA